jgi:uncharacterized protein (TIGR02145 family)
MCFFSMNVGGTRMKSVMGCLAGGFLCIVLFGCSTSDTNVPTAATSGDVEETGTIAAITVTTTPAVYLTSLSATVGGTAATDGAKIVERGVCYATTTKPTVANAVVKNGSGPGMYECALTNLASNTKYYARTYCKNGSGRYIYGPQVTFTTLQDYGTVTDADGNVYTTVTIGTQVWTQQNLRTTKYRDGSPIPNILDDVEWSDQVAGAFCNYNNDEGFVPVYGRLYNWYAVGDPRGLAPAGWRVPTYQEWRAMFDYLGGYDVAGGRLKETGITVWKTPNTGATNAAMFFARGTGSRKHYYPTDIGGFANMGYDGPYWTSSGSTSNVLNAQFVECFYGNTNALRTFFLGGIGYYDKRSGYAVRLIKDVQ